MRFPIINISESDFKRFKIFDVLYNSEIIINKENLESNFINHIYFDSNGNEYIITGYNLIRKEWNLIFFLNNWFRPLLKVELIFKKRGKKIEIEELRNILLSKSSQYAFIGNKSEKSTIEEDINNAQTFRELMNSVSEFIDDIDS